MASITHEGDGRRRIQFMARDGRRKGIRLGKVTARDAEAVRWFVEDLLSCRSTGKSPKPATDDWIAGMADSLRRKLERCGLLAAREYRECPTVAGWIGEYIAGRPDVKANTLRNFRQTERSLVEFFTAAKRLDQVTSGDADKYVIHLKETIVSRNPPRKMSEGTIRRRCKRARQFFTAAIKNKLIGENPFAGIKCGNYSNAERFYFVKVEEAQAVLDACPDAEWRLLFALCRYGGLRCPSEILRLRWGDVDWEGGRFTVHAGKTEHNEGGGIRHVPIFPELRPYLTECFEQAEPGTENIITRYGRADTNLRTQLTRIIKRAGLSPWPKLFQNLRSTRETELNERFPLHAVCQWLGNSMAIATKHYLQVTEEHFRRASEAAPDGETQVVQNPVQYPPELAGIGRNGQNGEPQKSPEFPGYSGIFRAVQNPPHTPTGGRTPAKNAQFSAILKKSGAESGATEAADGDLSHVAAAWPDLQDATKAAIVAIVDQAAAVESHVASATA